MHATSESIDIAVKKTAIDKWLSAPDPTINHNSAKARRHPDTGMWCLESSKYEEWKANANPCLWLHGIPGCGKTILSSTIIEDLQRSGYIVLYFYFDFNDETKQSFEKMLRSLVWQLYQRDEISRKHLDQLYSSCNAGSAQPQCKSLEETFKAMTAEAGNLKIVLDALDECATRTELLDWLASTAPKALHLLLTSRDLDEIKSSLTDWIPTTAIVPVEQGSVNPDIRAFVRSRLLHDRCFRRWHSMPGVYERIEMKLMEKADGM